MSYTICFIGRVKYTTLCKREKLDILFTLFLGSDDSNMSIDRELQLARLLINRHETVNSEQVMSVLAPTPNKKLTYVSLTVFSFLLHVYVHCVLLMFLNTGISIDHGHACLLFQSSSSAGTSYLQALSYK